MGTACPARPLREKFRSRWRDGLQRLSGAGAPRQPGPRVVSGQGPGGAAAGRRSTGPGSACAIPRIRAYSARGPERESPGLGGFLIRGYPTFRAPGGRAFSPGMRVRGTPRPCLRRRTPHAGAWRTPLQLDKVGSGLRGPLPWRGEGSKIPGPQLRGAPGCTTASARSPFGRSRPAALAGEEPRPRPIQPRPSRAAPGSPPQGLGH